MSLAYVSGEIDSFVEFLHVCHNIKPNPRTTITLSVRPYLTPTVTGNDNIAYLRHVVLDIENCELNPQTLDVGRVAQAAMPLSPTSQRGLSAENFSHRWGIAGSAV
jgi:hypothetical protein